MKSSSDPCYSISCKRPPDTRATPWQFRAADQRKTE
nr:MAG TPA: hypothetical protein [Caudoviricetes sp.]